jgi:hypothetical protein
VVLRGAVAATTGLHVVTFARVVAVMVLLQHLHVAASTTTLHAVPWASRLIRLVVNQGRTVKSASK